VHSIVSGDFLGLPEKTSTSKGDAISKTRSFIRHDGAKLAKQILSLF
jgi:hypothetical protein